jgi:peptidoglycan/LPS O-acetylase OafA/YrhL
MSTWKNRGQAQDPAGLFHYRPFGAFRFALAGMVLGQHCMLLLTPNERTVFFGLVLGPVAVACFFALSGFIVAEAMGRFYTDRPIAFMGNRLLRVVPPYVLALALAIAVQSALFAYGRLVALDVGLAGAPWQPRVILAGLCDIVPGLPGERISGQAFSFIPYAWTLRVEFAFYLAAFLAAAAMRRMGPPGAMGRTWVAVSALALAYLLFVRFVLRHGVGAQQILCVPFFAFGLACFFLCRRPGLMARLHLLAVSACVPLAFTYWTQKGHPVVVYQIACLCVLFAIFHALTRIARVPAAARGTDKRLGDLSYPLYIGHGVIVVALASLTDQRGWLLYAAGIVLSLLLAGVLHVVAERPVRGLRDRLRGRPV